MKNEFIVWDNKESCFIEDFASEEYEPLNDLFKNERYDFLKWIEKTDINDKKIFSDSSIVEFIHNWEVRKGYFKYCNKKLKYLIYDIASELHRDYNYSEIREFKIIDTLQENKLGLIK